MTGTDPSQAPPRPRRAAPWWPGVAVGAVILLVVAVGLGWWGTRPLQLHLAPVSTPEAVASAAPAGLPRADRLQRTLTTGLASPQLGRHVVGVVATMDGEIVASYGAGAVTPASTLKLVTGVAALQLLGPAHVFTTETWLDATTTPPTVTLVGGGDSELDDAGLSRLVRTTARRLDTTTVQVRYDASLFTGPAVSPQWPRTYLPDQVVTPVSALWVDEGLMPDGFHRYADPAAAAAQMFSEQLRATGVAVEGEPTPGVTTGVKIAEVESPTLAEIVTHMVQVSDNETAEVLLRQIGIAARGDGSFDAGVQGIADVLTSLGISTAGLELGDGSGLARTNLISPDSLIEVLTRSAADPELRAVVGALPVAAFSGSLAQRFRGPTYAGDPAGAGRVRAKTGTLSGVHALAGLVQDRTGTPYLFVLVADRVPDRFDDRAAPLLDQAAAALAACVCSTRG